VTVGAERHTRPVAPVLLGMSDPDTPSDIRSDTAVAAAWTAHRRRVLDVCYRMLGTLADAEDALQETFLRLSRHGVDGIDDVTGWLVTVAGRVCLDRLRADTTRRSYVGPWLPEPIVADAADPADQVTLDDSVRIALLAVLERLSPPERVAFVLHDVFGLTFDQVAEVVGRRPAACRKLASRARAAIRADAEPRFDVDPAAARRVVERFGAACASGDLESLVAVLDPAVVGELDSGGRIPGAPVTAQVGGHLVAATLLRAFAGSSAAFHVVDVNAQPGIVVRLRGRTMAVMTFETDGRRIHAIRAIGNPDKLASAGS
jgi:RNA polymerase sigma-70 factor (ECF subfamily)